MKVIYEPKGRAREYAPLALNLYTGCGHGCTYCYAPAATRQSRQKFACPKPRYGILEYLQRDMKHWDKTDTRTVLVSFSSDPYQPIYSEQHTTWSALSIMRKYVKNVAILTKGGSRSAADLYMLSEQNWRYGITLTTLDDEQAAQDEPNAAPPSERLEVLHKAIDMGIRCFVSIEPVMSPFDGVNVFESLYCTNVEIRVGTWNHAAAARGIDYADFLRAILDMARKRKARTYIKDDLARHGDVPPEFRVRTFEAECNT